jgi:hypothetical protein
MQTSKNPASRKRHLEHTWCSLCERTYPTGRWIARDWSCPAGCGAIALDALPWEEILEINPDYPVEPIEGKHYLLRPGSRSEGHPVKKRPCSNPG